MLSLTMFVIREDTYQRRCTVGALPQGLEPVVADDYSGLVGLNAQVENFQQYVMQPNDVQAFFANGAEYDALFAYPQAVANGFDAPPVFAAEI